MVDKDTSPYYEDLIIEGNIDTDSFSHIPSSERYIIPDEVHLIELKLDGTDELPERDYDERFLLEYFHKEIPGRTFGTVQVNDGLGLNYLIAESSVRRGIFEGFSIRVFKVKIKNTSP